MSERTYRIPVSTGVFEHCRRIGDAIWLLLWYVDKTTKEDPDGQGRVLGSVPVRDSNPAGALGVSTKTVGRWRQHLTVEGYITAKRTGQGYIIAVQKSKKWPNRSDIGVLSDRTDLSTHASSDGTEMSDHTSQTGQICPIRSPEMGNQIARNGRSNKTRQRQDNKTEECAVAKNAPRDATLFTPPEDPVEQLAFAGDKIRLDARELEKLTQKFPTIDVEGELKRCDTYHDAHNTQVRNSYRTAVNWMLNVWRKKPAGSDKPRFEDFREKHRREDEERWERRMRQLEAEQKARDEETRAIREEYARTGPFDFKAKLAEVTARSKAAEEASS